ncbi:GNAT family N-acetyltransferase [Cellulomonas fengjieae]|uniref:GNAT family N-acetyltransferase n=1 Tax=Cellulomonas fengjieae TaxID=2819978 RepID=A0ABS3SFL7_9CELL|nr:GNAT family N-acetyltransferase [Cellulomonas fengjieae]MBO3084550.1 GNAT family N-acetyltransferase [Cellulomonas fengjieae]QVI67117.1 GNAT family N-acetyltransferase [Cellulomonas fengjieae]
MSPLPDGYRLVDVPESRKDEFLEVDRLAFAFDSNAETDALVPITFTWDRTQAVEDPEGRLAAVHASYAHTMPVPGGTIACSGLTWVGARPDERRRGLLTAMIDSHFARSLDRGEPISALFAAEHAIYGRYGYGSAADDVRVKIARGAALRDTPGSADLTIRLATVDVAQHSELVDTLHRAAGAGRPGWTTRDSEAWRIRMLVDPPAWREGGEPLRIATVHDPAGAVRGYALFRRKENWSETGPAGTVKVREAAAVDAAATHRLWSFLLDLDLMATIESPMLPVDDALLHLLVDARAVTPRVSDNVWVRLLDLPVALAGRRYAAPVDVVLDVTDARLPANAGRWRLTTGDRLDDGTYPAEVSRTEDEADLRLDVRELGAAYLGGRSLVAQGRAGLVTEQTPGALHAAAVAFGWPVAPVCTYVW